MYRLGDWQPQECRLTPTLTFDLIRIQEPWILILRAGLTAPKNSVKINLDPDPDPDLGSGSES